MLKYKCKYTAEFFLCVLVVVGVHVVCCCSDIAGGAFPLPPATGFM